MPFKRNESGIFVPAGERPPFKCTYELDQRLDKELANLFQCMYRAIQSILGDQTKLRLRARQGIELYVSRI